MTRRVLPVAASFHELGTEAWLPARVPGCVHTDLMAAGVIPDPFVADNELRVQWVAERDWEYRVTFELPAELLLQERIELVCDGLDTLADVSINGRSLGHAENAFRQYRWDVTHVVIEGENRVDLVFPSTVNAMRRKQAMNPLIGPSQSIPGGAYVRKAPSQFGWDWGPQLPPIGIWKEMRLEVHAGARLEDVHVRQLHSEGAVKVMAQIAVERWSASELTAVLRLIDSAGRGQEAVLALGNAADTGLLEIEVVNPQLWWPNGFGAQPLYRLEIGLYSGDRLLDERTMSLGLRALVLRQEPDAFGTSFTFVVNGVPIFAKGANWIPADSFPARLTEASLERLIRSAVQANMNMLRVWGGGFYEDDRFYDLCDRYGILVWQDFIFSCSIYPGDAAFLDNVRIEVIQNIRRLRHHASLALWCGNNEMEGGWAHWGWKQRADPKYRDYYDAMFHHMLPELCAQEDPDHPYWPSSPSSGVPYFEDPGSVRAGDTHNWAVWHGGQPFEHYREHMARFISEFGFQSLPPLDTIRTYAEEREWNMTSYMMEHHQRNSSGNGKIINYMTAHFQLPKDFPSLVYLTQLLQAEAVRTGVEFWRRNRQCTSGALYWQLNDCWPVASWASLDYFGRWKALHYAARRFYAPVLLTAEAVREKPAEDYLFQPLPGPFVSLYLVNDLPQHWTGVVRWSLETLDGKVLKSAETSATVPAVTAVKGCDMDFAAIIDRDNERDVVLVYELLQEGRRCSLDIMPFVPSKHMKLTDPELTWTVAAVPEGFAVAVTARRLARFVALSLTQGEDPDLIFSDNYFDLPAGRTVTVTLPAREGWTADTVMSALCVRSLFDTF